MITVLTSRDQLCCEGAEDVGRSSSPNRPISDVVPAKVLAQSVRGPGWVASCNTMANAGKPDGTTEGGCVPVSSTDKTRSQNLGFAVSHNQVAKRLWVPGWILFGVFKR
jgi:hypothetical protein